MNENRAEQSKCWQCKFGLCVQEIEREHIFHAGQAPEDPFGVRQFGEATEEEGAIPDLIEHTLEHDRVRTLCFWRPEGVRFSPPILIAMVTKCSRFEQK